MNQVFRAINTRSTLNGCWKNLPLIIRKNAICTENSTKFNIKNTKVKIKNKILFFIV